MYRVKKINKTLSSKTWWEPKNIIFTEMQVIHTHYQLIMDRYDWFQLKMSNFLRALSFEGTTKRAYNYLNQNFKGFYF